MSPSSSAAAARRRPPQLVLPLLVFLAVAGDELHGLNWQDNLRPKLFCSMTGRDYTAFVGNVTDDDHFTKLFYSGDGGGKRSDGGELLIGARNILYKLSAGELRLTQTLVWHSSDFDRESCIVKGKDRDRCQNYITVLQRYSDDPNRYLVCGTNSFKPMCREYADERGSYVMRGERSGLGLAPFDPLHNSTAILVGEDLYSGTVADFTGVDPIIFRQPLRTQQYDSAQLNSPDFVGSFDHEVSFHCFVVCGARARSDRQFPPPPGLCLLLLPRGGRRVHQLRQVRLLPRGARLQERPGRAQQGQVLLDVVPQDQAELLGSRRVSGTYSPVIFAFQRR